MSSSIGSLLIGTENLPLGYVTPQFPALNSGIDLYSAGDILRFTLYWNLIMSTSAHLLCALASILSSRKIGQGMLKLSVYGLFGAIYGGIVGALSGLFFGGLYIAGALHMSTWVPFAWSFVPLIYLWITSFRETTSYM